jgi:hypothetical protein
MISTDFETRQLSIMSPGISRHETCDSLGARGREDFVPHARPRAVAVVLLGAIITAFVWFVGPWGP